MGIVSSRLDEGPALYLKDQNRFSLASVTITSSRRRTPLIVTPTSSPAQRLVAKRDPGDDGPIEFIQDPDTPSSSSAPSFLLRLNNDEDLTFTFSITVRQCQELVDQGTAATDTVLNGLTFIFAGSNKELDNLVTREFHADPNLHKNSNVELVGAEYSTGGNPSVSIDWSWKWRPPKANEDRGGGWRNACTFVEYDQRAHRLNTLASFSFWVQNVQRPFSSPMWLCPSPQFEMLAPPRLRVPSGYSVLSVMSDSEGQSELDIPSPVAEKDTALSLSYTSTKDLAVVDVSCQRPGEDMSAVDDGPLFRATMKALEQKTGNMKARMKKVLKKAEAAQVAQAQCNEAVSQFVAALQEASSSNANALQPALEHYFDKIAREILSYENQSTANLQKIIIDPLAKLYTIDIKQAESKKKDFEDESKEYYSYVSRYLGQRQDSMKEKKKVESDSKYQSKRRTFELKRFDYSSFMQDLHGGRKDQEVLTHLTKYADTQTKAYLATAKKIEEMVPQLDVLVREVSDANKEYQFQRTEREEKRRMLEKSTKPFVEPDSSAAMPGMGNATAANGDQAADSDHVRRNSVVRTSLHHTSSSSSQHGLISSGLALSQSVRTTGATPGTSPGPDRFKGIRDLEDRSQNATGGPNGMAGQQRKEGLCWALSRPGSHVDPRGLNKQAWHKFWIVLDQGRLSEYSNWKERLDLHRDPIDLRLASVREARNAERRFCFELITPNYTRVYQATSEEDMYNWINAVNNALQSAYEGRNLPQQFTPAPSSDPPLARDIGSVLTGKLSYHGSQHHSPSSSMSKPLGNMHRSTTVGARPSYTRTGSNSYNEDPTKLLQEIRERDQGNLWCADCGSNVKTEWVSINLGIVLCIECSGIHRSLGTHVSKVRSLTLDTVSLTTDVVEIIMQIGNRISNQIWEARLDQALKPQPQATRDSRLRFITDKYVERLHVNPISNTLSAHTTPEETLLSSIKKNDIQQVLYALALRANPNATDKLRQTHAIFLALAAADPASPQAGASPIPTGSPTMRKSMEKQLPKRTPTFAIAELLMQNGAEIPSTMPAFPLSSAAQRFIEQRGPKGGGDMLTALPSIRSPTGATEKERERLLKRTSAGARFGGKMVGGSPFG